MVTGLQKASMTGAVVLSISCELSTAQWPAYYNDWDRETVTDGTSTYKAATHRCQVPMIAASESQQLLSSWASRQSLMSRLYIILHFGVSEQTSAPILTTELTTTNRKYTNTLTLSMTKHAENTPPSTSRKQSLCCTHINQLKCHCPDIPTVSTRILEDCRSRISYGPQSLPNAKPTSNGSTKKYQYYM